MDSDSALRKSRRLEMMESWAGVRPGWVGGPRVPKRGGSRVRISELVPGVDATLQASRRA